MDATLDFVEKRGEKKGAELAVKLYSLLAADGRLGEWDKAITDSEILMKLLREYSLMNN